MKYNLYIIQIVFLLLNACSGGGSSVGVETVAYVGGSPDGVTVADSGNIYITDIANGDVKKIGEDGQVTFIANLGASSHPDGIVAVTSGTTEILYVANTGSSGVDILSTDGTISKITVASDGTVSTTPGFINSSVLDTPTGIAADQSGNLYVADQKTGDVYKVTVTGGVAGAPVSLTDNLLPGVTLSQPHGLTLVNNPDQSVTLYTTDQGAANNNIVRIDVPASGNVSAVVVKELTPDNTGGSDGDNVSNANFNKPHGIATKNGAVFVCDENNNRIQVITPSGNVMNIAGSGLAGDADGDEKNAMFKSPRGLAVDLEDNLLVCDYANGKVKRILR